MSARLLGPDLASSTVTVTDSSGRSLSLWGRTITVYTDAAATVLADIATYNGTTTPGATIAESALTIDRTSRVPQFWFPGDGADTLYGKVASEGIVVTLTANVDARFDALPVSADTAPAAPPRVQHRPTPVPSLVFPMASGHGWVTTGTAGTSNANDTRTGRFFPHISDRSLNFVTNGAGASYGYKKTGLTAFDLTGKMLKVSVRYQDIAPFKDLFLRVGENALVDYFTLKVATGAVGVQNRQRAGELVTYHVGWRDLQSTVGGATYTVTNFVPSKKGTFTDLKLDAFDQNTGTGVDINIVKVEIVAETNLAGTVKGVVSFSFDDTWDSQLLFARALNEYGWRGTFYNICDRADAGASDSRMTWSDLRGLADDGHEIAYHATDLVGHNASFTSFTRADLRAYFAAGKAAMLRQKLDSDNLAYPNGLFDLTADGYVVSDIAREFFNIGRTISPNPGLEHLPPSRPLELASRSGIGSGPSGYAVSSITANNTGQNYLIQQHGGWNIYTFHRNTAAVAPASSNEILDADFRLILADCLSRGLTVLPVREAMRIYAGV